jgi:hypothetical protein
MRSYLDPRCLKEPAVREVLDCLLAWLNHSLADSRVRITQLEEDLKDGMVLKLILCRLTGKAGASLLYPVRPSNSSCRAGTLSSPGSARRPT